MKRGEAATAISTRARWFALLCLAFFSLVLFPSALCADENLSCDYQYAANDTTLVHGFFAADGTLLTDFLHVESNSSTSTGSTCLLEFAVRNSAQTAVKVTIDYSVFLRDSTGTSVSEEVFPAATIGAGESTRIIRYYNVTSCELLATSYQYHDTRNASYRSRMLNVTRFRCTLCAGLPCLNDGMRCQSSAACGSGLCHDHTCVQRCPEDLFSCNGTCLRAGELRSGESFSCESQCRTGMGRDGRCIECTSDRQCTRGICDPVRGQCVEYYDDGTGGRFSCALAGRDYVPCHESTTCVLPGSRQSGESYACAVECASGFGRDGRCWPSPTALTLWTIGCLLFVLLLALTYHYRHGYRRLAVVPSEQRARTLHETLGEKQKAIRVLHAEKEELGRQLVQLKQELRQVQRENLTMEERYKTKEESFRRKQEELVDKMRVDRDIGIQAAQEAANQRERDTMLSAENSFKNRQKEFDAHIARLEKQNDQLREELRFIRQTVSEYHNQLKKDTA
jgi:hypothetical protein